MASSFVIVGERVVLPDAIRPCAILVRDGRIASVGAPADRPVGVATLDAGALLVMPGVVDTHVHMNDPGRADWEGFEHGTRAAAAGGVTTVVDMPLNSVPPTTSVEGFEAKRRAAHGRCTVDVGLWGGVVPGNANAIEALARAGVLGFKCFLSPSGVDEFRHVGEADLCEALPAVARTGLPLLAHAEWPGLLRDPLEAAGGQPLDPRRHDTWLASRPPEAERAAIDLLIRLAREHGASIHVVHLAAPEAIDAVRAARAEGLRITVETCPHYLTFAAEEIADGATPFKCAPPIRESSRRDGLWRALASGDIDLVATDHSPAPPLLKRLEDGDFVRAWGGIASIEVGLAAVWTGTAARGGTFGQLRRWLCEGPARLAGLAHRKGRIAPGCDADFVIWDPDASFVVDGARLHHRHQTTPYQGRRLRGVVHRTIVRGEIVYDQGTFPTQGHGKVLLRADC